MKKLLATTALCLVFSTGITSPAQASTIVSSIDTAQIISVNTAYHAPSAEVNLYRGDFQESSKPALQNTLYTGTGAALMSSIRFYAN